MRPVTTTVPTRTIAAPGISPRPRRALAVLTCMDTRIDPLAILDLGLGDAHIIRNAGGLISADAIRSLSASQRLLGTTKIIVMMHEDCGLQGASDEEFLELLAAEGVTPTWRLGGFENIETALQDGLIRLRSSRELPSRDQIRGLIFDPATGTLREIAVPAGQQSPSS